MFIFDVLYSHNVTTFISHHNSSSVFTKLRDIFIKAPQRSIIWHLHIQYKTKDVLNNYPDCYEYGTTNQYAIYICLLIRYFRAVTPVNSLIAGCWLQRSYWDKSSKYVKFVGILSNVSRMSTRICVTHGYRYAPFIVSTIYSSYRRLWLHQMRLISVLAKATRPVLNVKLKLFTFPEHMSFTKEFWMILWHLPPFFIGNCMFIICFSKGKFYDANTY